MSYLNINPKKDMFVKSGTRGETYFLISSASRLVNYFPDVSKIFDIYNPNILMCENNVPDISQYQFPIKSGNMSLLQIFTWKIT